MKAKWFLLGGLVCGVLWLFAQQLNTDPQAQILYAEALRLYNLTEANDHTDSLSTVYFQQAAQLFADTRSNLFYKIDCHEKTGILYQTIGNHRKAIEYYRAAIDYGQRHQAPDTLLYRVHLYGGSAYYFKGILDSATLYLEQAEKTLKQYPTLGEGSRLFNSFGALYFEAGNYRQSINYFQKALQTTPQNIETIYTYKNNIASALRNLGDYDSAIAVYRSVLPFKKDPYELYINLGATLVEKNMPETALTYLWKAGERSGNHGIVLQNALGKAHMQQKKWLEADFHFRQALRINLQDFGTQSRNVNAANTHKLRGDLANQQQKPDSALIHYQRAINLLVRDFETLNVLRNPNDFSQVFNSFQLFEVIAAKAQTFGKLFTQTGLSTQQAGAIEAYKTVFKLAVYAQKTLDNDDARLYLARKGFPIYQEAVQWMMSVYQKTKQPQHLELAFTWAEQSKATVLQINLKEARIKPKSDIPDSLLRQEQNLHYHRSGLLLRLSNATDSLEAAIFSRQLLDNEVALSRLSDRLHDFPAYYQQKFSTDSINITLLKSRILDKQTALLSYFQIKDSIFCFVLTSTKLASFVVKKDDLFDKSLTNLLLNLRRVEAGRPYGGSAYSQYLYASLLKPAEQYLRDINALIVLPYADLSLLPFEILEDFQRHYLLEKYHFTYQYSVAFLGNPSSKSIEFGKALAVAPFSQKTLSTYTTLVASTAEIAPLKGNKLIGKEATKSHFLELAAESSTIHLATHAVANNADPLQSYIAFFPNEANHRLYAHELADGLLSKTQLVFLSACETASGKIEQGEGVMSLARTFALAGCNHLITSLWKAEDHATAYISERFYTYTREGYSLPEALRKAKLDLLKDNRYAQFHSPQYWSHLIYIGTPAPQTHWPVWGWTLLGVMILSGAIAFVFLKKAKHTS